MKYQRVMLTKAGGPQVLQLREDELPEPGPDEVRVKILAAGVAFADVLMRYGKYPGLPRLPFTPGYDLVGMVEKCGAAARTYAVGTMVAALPRFGGYSQYICLSEHELVPVPGEIDPAEGVCLVLNYLTAYQMLHRVAHVKVGQRVLVYGAAGGVGTALLQLGKLFGLEMYGTASPTKHETVAALGAIPIDYTREDVVARVRALTGDGVDAVFDPIGGNHLQQSFRTLRPGGTLVAYGFSSSMGGLPIALTLLIMVLQLAFWSIFPNGKRATFYSVVGFQGFKNNHPDWFREDLLTLFDLLAARQIKPLIAARLPLSQIAQAHERMEGGHVQGKLVLIPNEEKASTTH
ncbi:medium chain dehydrogenase/reductase family protein [Dictyobacter formicarum]|uniref:NADPH:quinone reductase n=1 Tax=Dictyobacter formicarum TaxID=2778368 RepID=A0ABQ3VAK6_9CHLR|nr:medium chain dehydrogenase/reductase family protein [Dictyobacter formicarum]GHO83180.1 NADPH:quinone reductase [Dictyobacter formicarum]